MVKHSYEVGEPYQLICLDVMMPGMDGMEVLQEINKNGNTILMATHDYALLLKYPSKTLKCDENRVFEVVQRKD